MNKIIILCLGFAAVVAPLQAQNDNSQPSPGIPGAGEKQWKKHGKPHGPPPFDNLTADEQQRLDAARETAKNDPTVRSLHEARKSIEDQLDNAMRAAMMAADPSLAPTLEKIKQARDRAKQVRDNFESLTPEQRQRLKAARGAAKDDAAVQAAREKLRSAQGPEAKHEAARAMHEAMKAAMLKADPELGPLLEKMGPEAMGGPDHQGRGGPHGPPPGWEKPPMDEGI